MKVWIDEDFDLTRPCVYKHGHFASQSSLNQLFTQQIHDLKGKQNPTPVEDVNLKKVDTYTCKQSSAEVDN